MATRGAVKDKVVGPNSKHMEAVYTSITKICKEVATENEIRATMEEMENQASSAKGKINVIEHVMTSSEGIVRAISGIRNGIEHAKKTRGQHNGVDIVQILSEGARLAETGDAETHVFVLRGIAQCYENQIDKCKAAIENSRKIRKDEGEMLIAAVKRFLRQTGCDN